MREQADASHVGAVRAFIRRSPAAAVLFTSRLPPCLSEPGHAGVAHRFPQTEVCE